MKFKDFRTEELLTEHLDGDEFSGFEKPEFCRVYEDGTVYAGPIFQDLVCEMDPEVAVRVVQAQGYPRLGRAQNGGKPVDKPRIRRLNIPEKGEQ